MNVKENTTEKIYHGKVFSLFKDNFTLPNGVTVDLEILRHPGAAAIVAVSEDLNILMVRQYRYAVRGLIWEIPAGTLDPGETPAACAERELAEETGYTASDFKQLGEIVPVPGYSDERITLFLAEKLSPVTQSLEKDEYLSVHMVPFDDALSMIYKGLIQDAKTITGLLLARKKIEQIIR